MNPVCQPVQFPSSGWITTAPLHGGPEHTASCWLIIKQHRLLQRDSMSQFCCNYAGLAETAANADRSQSGERCACEMGALGCFVATRRATSHVGLPTRPRPPSVEMKILTLITVFRASSNLLRQRHQTGSFSFFFSCCWHFSGLLGSSETRQTLSK